MPAPAYAVVTDAELAPGQPITSSLMTRLRNGWMAVLGVDPTDTNPSVAFGIKGELHLERGYSRVVGATVANPSTGVYTWVVPAGVSRALVDIVGGGGAGIHWYLGGGGNGGDTTIVDTTDSTTLVVAHGGQGGSSSGPGGAGGSANGLCKAGGNGGTGGPGGGAAGPYCAGLVGDGTTQVMLPGFGPSFGHGGYGTGTDGDIGGGGGGAAGGSGLILLTPGHTLTITIGAGGSGGSWAGDGLPGMCRIRF